MRIDERTDVLTSDGFLADIITNPGDDTPRLIYADWLDEHGKPELADFIRVQVELAALGPTHCNHAEEPRYSYCKWCGQHWPLRRREREMLEAYWPDWFRFQHDLKGYSLGLNGTSIGVQLPGGPAWFAIRRGFVAAWEGTLACWCGQECRTCQGGGRVVERHPWMMSGEGWSIPCRVCHGRCRIGAHGPVLVRAAPLERVTLEADFHMLESPLPGRWIFVQLPVSIQVPDWLLPALQEVYPSQEEGLAALSDICLNWARNLAGLPPL